MENLHHINIYNKNNNKHRNIIELNGFPSLPSKKRSQEETTNQSELYQASHPGVLPGQEPMQDKQVAICRDVGDLSLGKNLWVCLMAI